MKYIILTLLLGSYALAFAQNKIKGEWYLYELFGKKTSMEMFRLERQTQERSGYRIELDKDKTFYSTYFAPCGLDCFVNTRGKFLIFNIPQSLRIRMAVA